MPGLALKVILQDIKKFDTEALVVGFHEDVRPLKGLAGELDWLLCGSLSNLILSHKVTGSLDDVVLITSRGKIPAQKIFMVGLGPSKSLTATTMKHVARSVGASIARAGISNFALECFSVHGEMPNASMMHALRDGLADGTGGREITVSLLAPDAVWFEKLSRLIKP